VVVGGGLAAGGTPVGIEIVLTRGSVMPQWGRLAPGVRLRTQPKFPEAVPLLY
jgi:hypothetical protein